MTPAIFGGLDLQEAREISAKTTPSGSPAVWNVRPIVLPSGLEAARYEIRNEFHPEYPIETVFISYPKKSYNKVGDEVNGISIRTLHDGAFSEAVFSAFISSFQFVNDSHSS